MLRQSILLIFLLSMFAHGQTYTQINEPRGSYPLDFNTIYEITASLDVETAITLPEGYIFKHMRSGTIDFINAFVQQNVLFITRTIDHRFDNTSVIALVEVPTGEQRQLVFKVKGGPGLSIVYAVHFVAEKGTNREIEAVKQRYEHQMSLALEDKEKELNTSVKTSTMTNALPLFFKAHRGDLHKEYKGASVYIEGIILNESDAYVYLRGSVRKDNCDVIKLIALKHKKTTLPAELIDVKENTNGTWSYIYKVPMIPVTKKIKIRFLFEIWSKPFSLSTHVS